MPLCVRSVIQAFQKSLLTVAIWRRLFPVFCFYFFVAGVNCQNLSHKPRKHWYCLWVIILDNGSDFSSTVVLPDPARKLPIRLSIPEHSVNQQVGVSYKDKSRGQVPFVGPNEAPSMSARALMTNSRPVNLRTRIGELILVSNQLETR